MVGAAAVVALPTDLTSAAAGTAPPWSSYTRYCQAIELIRPDGAMARDVLGNQDASREGYERLCSDGYGDVVIPVWQAAVLPASTVSCTAADHNEFPLFRV